MTNQTVKPLSFFGGVIAILCFLPFMWGLIIGVLISPFIAGFKFGREVADQIATDEFIDGEQR